MNRTPGKTVALILAAWTCFALAVGIGGWFRNASALGVAGTIWILSAIALLAAWAIHPIRTWATDVDLRQLLLFHLIRFAAGVSFIAASRSGALPSRFATPAGIGDIIVALFAVWVLIRFRSPNGPTLLFIWNMVGFVDIIFVVFLALRAGLRDWPSMAPLRSLPLSLLPTLIVPLIIASHILILVRSQKRARSILPD